MSCRRLAWIRARGALATGIAVAALQALVAPQARAAAAPGDTDRLAEATAHFDRGVALYRDEVWAAALTEFLEARRLYPTWSATARAARCLQKLQRYEEALDMFERLLRDFAASLPDDARAAAEEEVVKLRALVGTVDVQGAEPGATIAIDGQTRGDFPLAGPVRIAAGPHVVRVYKQGFAPFEASINVIGGQTTRVTARLELLVRVGTLRVAEKSGRALDVFIDGQGVGKTPWEGRLTAGSHVLQLLSRERFGTHPTPISIEKGGVTSLTLAAIRLDRSLITNAPRELALREGEPTPPGYHLATRPRVGLVVAGSVIFGVLYTSTSSIGLIAGAEGHMVPVLGPLFYLPVADSTAQGVFLAIDSFLQASGVAMAVAGFMWPERYWQSDVMKRPAPRRFAVAPVPLGRGGVGLSLHLDL